MPKYPLSEMEYGETILLQADLYHYMLSYQKCIAQVSCGIINTNSVFIPCSKTLLQYLHRVYAQKRLRVYAHMRHKHKLFKGSFFKFFIEPDEEVFNLQGF